MGEYAREQRNQLSRAVANSETKGKQMKGFVDNRLNSYVKQMAVYVTKPSKRSSKKATKTDIMICLDKLNLNKQAKDELQSFIDNASPDIFLDSISPANLLTAINSYVSKVNALPTTVDPIVEAIAKYEDKTINYETYNNVVDTAVAQGFKGERAHNSNRVREYPKSLLEELRTECGYNKDAIRLLIEKTFGLNLRPGKTVDWDAI